ncbi:MAG: hypothetical protein CW345_08725 [Firmicutes bacterium]|nr:hypothetical protein [Bacillota bacterium]MBO2521868.1 hypothetical protein [Bacillota bacterium]
MDLSLKKSWLYLLVALAAAAVAVSLAGDRSPLSAQTQSPVGFIDRDLVLRSYAGEAIAAVLAERDRLQEEFDRIAARLDEEAKLALFQEYEERLARYEEEMGIDQLIGDIDQALAAAAAEAGVSVVVDQSAVVWGGVDLTGAVLRRLGVIQ